MLPSLSLYIVEITEIVQLARLQVLRPNLCVVFTVTILGGVELLTLSILLFIVETLLTYKSGLESKEKERLSCVIGVVFRGGGGRQCLNP